MFFKSLSLAAVIGISLSLSAPVAAQSSAVNAAKIEILERQVRALRARLGMGDVPPASESASATPGDADVAADMVAKIGSLEAQIRRLTGRLEEFEFRQRQTGEEIELLRKEMELMRSEMGSGAATQPAAVAQPSPAVVQPEDGGEALAPVEDTKPVITLPAGDAATQFDYAFSFVRKNDLESGRDALEKFVAANPGDSRVGNAKYWLGRIHLQQGRHAQAAQYLLRLIEEHPNHDKRPDALVDLADALLKLDSATDACNALAEFRRDEDKASARLKSRAERLRSAARCG